MFKTLMMDISLVETLTCGFLYFQVKELFKELNVKCNALELDLMGKSTITVYHFAYQMAL